MLAALAILVLALLICAPLALVVAWFARRDLTALQEKLGRLERRLADMQAGPGGPDAGPAAAAREVDITLSQPEPVRAVARTEPAGPGTLTAAPGPTPAHRPFATRLPADIESLVGGQWLTWLGVLAIFFGTAFFLAYDLGESPLAGAGQILTGLLVAVVFVTGGRALSRGRQRFLGQGLLGGGVALLYVAAYAAHAFHHLVPGAVVYPFLLGSALIGAVLAMGENSLMVATLTQTGAVMTPFLLAVQGNAARVLFPYLIAVNIGTVLVAVRRRWPLLPLLGFIGSALLVLRWWEDMQVHNFRLMVLAGGSVLWLLYALFPILSRPGTGAWGAARSMVVVGNGLLFELFVYDLLAPEYVLFRGTATALLALVYAAGARAAELKRGLSPGVKMSHYTGIALAALAVPIQFDLAWVTLGWALLGAVLLWSGISLRDLGDRVLALLVYLMAVFRVLILDTLDSLQRPEVHRPLLNGDFLVGVATTAVLGFSAWLVSRNRDRLEGWEHRLVTPFILVAASLLLWRISVESILVFKSRETLLGADLNLALLLTLSLIWAVYAGALIASGFLFRYRPIRYLGIWVLAILLLKVFLFDMQALEKGYRIASFAGVGFLLLLISILYQRERRG